jgi:hypothetical protein
MLQVRIYLVQCREWWWALVNTVINLWILWNMGHFLVNLMNIWFLRRLLLCGVSWKNDIVFTLYKQSILSFLQQCRMQKLSFGPVFNLDLFSTCGAICVSKESVPPKRDLEELITLCGGRIVNSVRCACLLVGNGSCVRHEHVKHVDEKWVLDSIQFITLKPLNEYTLWGKSFWFWMENDISSFLVGIVLKMSSFVSV